MLIWSLPRRSSKIFHQLVRLAGGDQDIVLEAIIACPKGENAAKLKDVVSFVAERRLLQR